MSNDLQNIQSMLQDANALGLVFRGGFTITESDLVPVIEKNSAFLLLLFGHAGGSIWPTFSRSAEYADGKSDPMNRWSERVAYDLEERYNAQAFFPFGGPPYRPFLRWAKRAEGLQNSKLGMLIHPLYGLWHAYRFALALPVSDPAVAEYVNELKGEKSDLPHDICHQCDAQPCLKICPVSAFDGDSYNVEACYRFLTASPDAVCHEQGCQARVACPVGQDHLYPPDQAAFHIAQFIKAQSRVFDEDSVD